MTDSTTTDARETITLERTYKASIDDVWALWTTREGIESWWGPEGFTVTVRRLDLRRGGGLEYTMTATAPDQVKFMTDAGMPLANDLAITYTDVVAPVRLAYTNHVDFIPDHGAYDVGTLVELHSAGELVRMAVTIDAMHDAEWTRRAVAGWESELGKLDRLLAERRWGPEAGVANRITPSLGKDHRPMPDAQAPNITGVDFVSIPTTDLARSMDFYEHTLGLQRSSVWQRLGRDPVGAEYETGTLTLALMACARLGNEFQAHNVPIALRVDDVAKAREALEARGVKFLQETIDSGVCHQALFKDPDGNVLDLHHRYAPRSEARH